MKVKLPSKEVHRLLEIESPEFPKYVTQIINLANQNAQGTRPRVVGQLSDLIQEFRGHDLSEWQDWYTKKYPESIKTATDKITAMVEQLKDAMDKIDRTMIERWVRDLVFVKTFVGLRFQKAVLAKLAELHGTSFSLAAPAEESRGIDGYVGTVPISIKPITYKQKADLAEIIHGNIVYYKKVKDGIEIEFDF
jgi:uncharacterized protein YukE